MRGGWISEAKSKPDEPSSAPHALVHFPLAYLQELPYAFLVGNQGEGMSKPTDMVQGTLDLLILKALTLGPMHGWSIAQQIKTRSKDILQVQQGSLYPALHKLETIGLVAPEWGENEI